MELFKVLQPSMFGLLTSKNRNIYLSSLFILRKAFLQEYNIEKDKLVRQLTQNIEKLLLDIDYESEDISDKIVLREPRSIASFVIKRFEETGWIECDYINVGGFKENVSIPPYAIKLLNTLYDISYETDSPYTVHLYNVYSTLYSAITSKQDYLYISLCNAVDELDKLESALKILSYDLKKRYRTISLMNNSNEILAEHFDDYHQRIVKLILIPLKSKDSVSRFRGSIVELLIKLLRDKELMRLASDQAFFSGKYANQLIASSGVRQMVEQISDRLSEAEELLDAIDARNNAYISSVTQKLKYMISSSKSTKKRLQAILNKMKHQNHDDIDFELLGDQLALTKQSYFDTNSLYVRAQGERNEYSPPLEIEDVPEVENGASFVEDALNSPFTYKNMIAHLEELMAGKNEFNLVEWPNFDVQEMIIAVNLTIRGFDQNIFYKTQLDNDKRIQSPEFDMPDTTFIRRRKL